jgi:hypothetical protein
VRIRMMGSKQDEAVAAILERCNEKKKDIGLEI